MPPDTLLSTDPYPQIFETAPDALLVVGGDQRIVLVNAQAEKLFGYTRAELVGQSLDVLVPERFRSTHGAHVGRYLASPGTRPMGSGLELFGQRKDGTELAIEVSLSPLNAAGGRWVCAAVRDISERRRLEAAAKVISARLASAVESIQDAFAIFDADDRLVLCNGAYRALCPTVAEIVGLTFAEILEARLPSFDFEGEAERERFRAERLAERADPKGAVDVHTKEGRRLRITTRRTPDAGIVQTIWDLTEDMQREEELRQARIQSEAGSAAKSEFLSSMSHELRTPLNAILGFAQLLQRDKREPLSERHKGRVEQILRGGEHLLRLIDDILDLSRIEAGGVSISMEPVSVPDVLDEVRQTLEPLSARQGIAVEIAPLPSPLPMVRADRTRFAQILMNFGSNAIKYNRPRGTVTFLVSVPSPDRLRVEVTDTGMGIPEDKQEKLFQPFQRAGQETGPIEGTGIGLVITKRLAELMRGSVGFRSTPGEGSTFWVEVPTHVATTRPEVPAAAPVALVDAPASHAKRRVVVYIEDNPANVTFMRDLVGTFDDVELLTSPTAEMGVELVRARRPAVVLMDVNLPGMSGLEALRVLRADPATARVPVIALTAAASERDKQRGVEAGFYRYLTKPVRVDELVGALEELFDAS